MERLLRVQNILARCKTQHDTKPAPEAEGASQRSTNPDAPMELVLRFTTEFGPRTIIASGVSLQTASAITLEMMRAGHFAEYADQRPRPALAVSRRARDRGADVAHAGTSGLRGIGIRLVSHPLSDAQPAI